MYSTGNYIQYLVVNYNGKESKKIYRYIHIYVYLNHFAVHLKLTQHCKSTILQFKKRRREQGGVFPVWGFMLKWTVCNYKLKNKTKLFSFLKAWAWPRSPPEETGTTELPSWWFCGLQSGWAPNTEGEKCFSLLRVTKFSTYLCLAYKYRRQSASYCLVEWSPLQASF